MKPHTLVIAEAGVNHNGSVSRALALVDAAADAGADVVKFQTFRADALATASAGRAAYQAKNTDDDGPQQDMLRKLELSQEAHHAIVARCQARGIRFMSTAFDEQSLDFLARFDMPAIKVPSGDITCAPLLLKAARQGRPLVVSTGMSDLADIEAALGVIAFALTHSTAPASRSDFATAYASPEGRAALCENVTLLHCVTQYPAPPEAVNLRAMDTMRAAFGLPIGYSDHTLGIEISLAAVARGATVIEKHFTLDRGLPGPDHAASLEANELAQMITGIRAIEAALGNGVKFPHPVEAPNRHIGRRGIVAAQPIGRGHVLTEADLACKRPADGRCPLDWWDLLGVPADRDYAADEPIGGSA